MIGAGPDTQTPTRSPSPSPKAPETTGHSIIEATSALKYVVLTPSGPYLSCPPPSNNPSQKTNPAPQNCGRRNVIRPLDKHKSIDLTLFVYTKTLHSNCRCDVRVLAEHGRLCTPVHKRVHRQRPLFGRSGRRQPGEMGGIGPIDPDPGANTSDCYQPGIGRSWYPAHQRTGPLPRRVGNWCASHPPTHGSDRLIDDRQMRTARLPGCQIYLARIWVLLTMSISHHRS